MSSSLAMILTAPVTVSGSGPEKVSEEVKDEVVELIRRFRDETDPDKRCDLAKQLGPIRDARVTVALVSGKGAASPPPPPLRTVRESCPSYGSSRPLPSVLPEALSRMDRCIASGSVCRPTAGSHLTCPFGLHNPSGSCRVVHPAHVSRLSA